VRLITAWCPTCREECVPHRDRCMFCGGRAVSLSLAPADELAASRAGKSERPLPPRVRRSTRGGKPHPLNLRERARAMRDEGREFREIADELGVGLATAYRWAGRSEVAA
jgi:hypothetical protein